MGEKPMGRTADETENDTASAAMKREDLRQSAGASDVGAGGVAGIAIKEQGVSRPQPTKAAAALKAADPRKAAEAMKAPGASKATGGPDFPWDEASGMKADAAKKASGAEKVAGWEDAPPENDPMAGATLVNTTRSNIPSSGAVTGAPGEVMDADPAGAAAAGIRIDPTVANPPPPPPTMARPLPGKPPKGVPGKPNPLAVGAPDDAFDADPAAGEFAGAAGIRIDPTVANPQPAMADLPRGKPPKGVPGKPDPLAVGAPDDAFDADPAADDPAGEDVEGLDLMAGANNVNTTRSNIKNSGSVVAATEGGTATGQDAARVAGDPVPDIDVI